MKNGIVSISLAIGLILSLGLAGCGGQGAPQTTEYRLTISSTEGGSVVTPEQGTGNFTYDEGTVASLVAEAQEGYDFVNWTGDVGTIADVSAASTTITMNGDYQIMANFALEIPGIRDWYDLDAIRDNLGGSYVLMNDLDATTAGYEELASPAANQGKGWEPIGTAIIDPFDYLEPYIRAEPFTGTFDGQRHEIRDLFIRRPDEDAVGLFGAIDEGGVLANIGVVDIRVTGGAGVGGLAGANAYEGSVKNAYSTGTVTGIMGVGGLVGANGYEGTISNSYSTATVNGDMIVGGLVGANGYGGAVSNSYSTGSATGIMGGAGGLVGVNNGGALIQNSFSVGNVTGGELIGGLVADNWEGVVYDSFWDTQASGTQVSAGGVGKTTEEMQNADTFMNAAWDIVVVTVGVADIAYVWNIVEGQTYPFLSWQSVS